MFNLQGSEIIIVMLLALVVLGPEKLPDAMRKLGQAYAELKKMSSGFQSEFRAAVEEPMREIRDTANILRDSADFTKLQSGERDEKPKSGDMGPVEGTDAPSDDIPTFEQVPDGGESGPSTAPDSQPAPFSDSSEDPTGPDGMRGTSPSPTEIPVPPAPFTGMSAPKPAVTESRIEPTEEATAEPAGDAIVPPDEPVEPYEPVEPVEPDQPGADAAEQADTTR